jgi:hypothetical protein
MSRTATALSIAILAITVLAPCAAVCKEVVVELTSIAAAMRPAEEQKTAADVALDPRLAPLSKNLRSLFAYDSYTFLDRTRLTIERGSALPFKLPEHFSLEVAPQELQDGDSDMIEMTITLFREDDRASRRRGDRAVERQVILRTKIRLKDGGTVLLGGPPIRSGVLVMALSARG